MRVLHYRNHFSLLSETFVYDFLLELERQEGDQHIVTFERQNRADRPFPRVHELAAPHPWHPGRLFHRARRKVGAAPALTYLWPMLQARLRRTITRVRPDVIHAHFGPEGALIFPVARTLGIPLITSFYGYDASRAMEDPVLRDVMQATVLQGNTISLSRQMRDEIIGFGAIPDRAHIVHLGKQLDAYPFSPSPRVRRFLSVGRLTEKKGHLDMLDAFASVVQRFPDAHLDIAGGGHMRDQIDERITRAG